MKAVVAAVPTKDHRKNKSSLISDNIQTLEQNEQLLGLEVKPVDGGRKLQTLEYENGNHQLTSKELKSWSKEARRGFGEQPIAALKSQHEEI